MNAPAKTLTVEAIAEGDAVDLATQLVDNLMRPTALLIKANGGQAEVITFFTATVIAALHLCEQELGNAITQRLAQHALRVTQDGWRREEAEGVH